MRCQKGHLTWPLHPPEQTKTKSKKEKKKWTPPTKKKPPKTPKMRFSVISQFFCFLGGSENSLFWQLGPKSAHPQNTMQIGVSASQFLKNRSASRNSHSWTKKPKSRNSSYHFFLPFPSPSFIYLSVFVFLLVLSFFHSYVCLLFLYFLLLCFHVLFWLHSAWSKQQKQLKEKWRETKNRKQQKQINKQKEKRNWKTKCRFQTLNVDLKNSKKNSVWRAM